MNQLRRMVLVNSASVRYREVELDGHIHFIGTQGTGKSTLLRAILFFYNADQRKLGISKEKKSFVEFYFPHADSYIFYEVQAGARRFCVWLYKRKGRLCFRFVDGAYDPSLAIENNAARSEGEVLAKAAALGFKVERAIYRLTEYRDILYGENRSFRRYALMQSGSGYSTIPRTISNIFLNANLDGDHIKKTIIDSLSDEPMEINLETNRHHLETARSHYADVVAYQDNEPQAEQIVAAYKTMLDLEEQQMEAAWNVGAAFNQAQRQQRLLDGQITEKTEAERSQKEKLAVVRKRFDVEKRRLGDQLAGVKKDIARANKLTRDYAEMGIDSLLEESKKAPQLEQDLSHCSEQLRVLTAKVEQQEQQFEIAVQKLKNESEGRVQQLRAELSDSKDLHRAEQESARKEVDQQRELLNADFEVSCGGYKRERATTDDALKELRFELRQLDQTLFFEEERAVLEERDVKLGQERIYAEELQKQIKAKIEAQRREAEDRLQMAEIDGDNVLRPLTEKREVLKGRLADRKEKLTALGGSLLEFLDDQVDGWAETIGKVVSHDVLLHSGLEPKTGAGQSLYGVDLKLEHLESDPLSKTGLLEEISSTEKELATLAKQIEKQLSENRVALDRLQQRYNRKIRELKDSAQTASGDCFKLERDLERNEMARRELIEKATAKRAEKQKVLEEQGHKVRKQLQELDALLADLTQKNEASQKRITTDFDRRSKRLEKEIQQTAKDSAEKISEQFQGLEEKLKTLRAERDDVLKNQGVDVKKVAFLDARAETLQKQLEAIAENARTLIEYQKDKREWIDKRSRFQSEREQIENKLAHQVELFERRIRLENEKLAEVSVELVQLREDHKQTADEVSAFEAFEREELFGAFESTIRHHDHLETSNCREGINKLKNLALSCLEKHSALTERITGFSGFFTEGNCLGFNVHLAGEAAFRSFAEMLTAFIRDQKIITLKTEVTRKYSMVLDAIVTETNRLLEREGNVHKVIQKINNDFRTANFVGVVRSIEMRVQKSSNRIFQVLRELCTFQIENHMSFGELDLFNSGNSGADEMAVDLLDQLRVQMGQTKSTKLKLEDALDLEFRVCENENDTSWVSRLANVGSNGTDVLVKSMIYINLLSTFKTGSRKQSEPAQLHCLVDEVGILHDSNVTSLINFAAERGICMINGSPNSHNEQDYKHIYIFRKEPKTHTTEITKLLSHAV